MPFLLAVPKTDAPYTSVALALALLVLLAAMFVNIDVFEVRCST
jgi:hypothetical protein